MARRPSRGSGATNYPRPRAKRDPAIKQHQDKLYKMTERLRQLEYDYARMRAAHDILVDECRSRFAAVDIDPFRRAGDAEEE